MVTHAQCATTVMNISSTNYQKQGLRSFTLIKLHQWEQNHCLESIRINYNLSVNDASGRMFHGAPMIQVQEYGYTCHYKSGSAVILVVDLSDSTPGDNVSEKSHAIWSQAASGASCHSSTT